MNDYIVIVFEVTFTIVCVYLVTYLTGLLLHRMPDIIDSIIYLFHYIRELRNSKRK